MPESNNKSESEINRYYHKKRFTFARIWLIIFVIVLIISAFLSISLWKYLAENEEYSPKKINDTVLYYYKTKNIEKIVKLSQDYIDALPYPDLFCNNIADVIKTDKIFSYQTNSNDNEIEYAIINDNKKISKLTLQKSGNKSKHNFDEYIIKSLEHFPQYTYSITAPENCDIVIDNISINNKNNTETIHSEKAFEIIKEPVYNTIQYKIETFVPINNIYAVSLDKQMCDIIWEKGKFDIKIKRPIPQNINNDILRLAEEFIKNYMPYISGRSVKGEKTLSFIYPQTQLYKILASFTNKWGEVYNTSEFENIKIDNITMYSPKSYSCDASAEYHIVAYNGIEKVFRFSYRLYWAQHNNTWKIISMKHI